MKSFHTTLFTAIFSSMVAASVSPPSCPISITPTFPEGQTALSVPAGQTAKFVALGRGVQNYTCVAATSNATSPAWTSAGAVAALFDVSCLTPLPTPVTKLPAQAVSLALNPLSTPVFGSCSSRRARQVGSFDDFIKSELAQAGVVSRGRCSSMPGYLGLHTFIAATNGTIAPKFDFTETLCSRDAFVVGSKVGSINSPSDPTSDVPWLELTSVSGTLAATVFRTDTAGGQPPATCTTVGDSLSVQYAALYWFTS